MRKIIYYGISSDAPFLPSPFLPKFLELLHNTFDTLAAYGAFSTVNGNVVIIGRHWDAFRSRNHGELRRAYTELLRVIQCLRLFVNQSGNVQYAELLKILQKW